MYMYVLLLLQVFKSSCNCRKLLYCSRLSKLFNDDNQTAIAARPCTVGVSLFLFLLLFSVCNYTNNNFRYGICCWFVINVYK